MSTWSKCVVAAGVLAFLIPFMILVVRRLRRGEFRDGGINAMLPPSGPDVGGI